MTSMRLIAHISLSNFFVAAARAEDPGLAGMPLAVTRQNRVIDASAEAAADGVIPGLSGRHARQACPELKLIEPKIHKYKDRVAEFAEKCYGLSPRVEIIAENEAFIDLSGSKPASARTLGNLAGDLAPRLGSSAVISLAPCRLLARAAAMTQLTAGCRAEPHAFPGLLAKSYDRFQLYVVKTETAGEFASRLPVEMMWPLAGEVIRRLKSLGLHSFNDISRIPLTMLGQQFGPQAPVIMNYSRGLDDTKVPVFRPPDSVVYHASCECADKARLAELLKQAALFLSQSLHKRGESYRRLDLSVFFADHQRQTKTSAFSRGKYDIRSIYLDCLNLFNRLEVSAPVTEITLTAAKLEANRYSQTALFADPQTFNSRAAGHREKLAGVCRDLAGKYAPGVITMGKSLAVSRREQMLMFVDPLRQEG